MNFTYLNYGENFLEEIKKRNFNEDTILVFSDYFFKNSYMKIREKNILVKEPKYLTIDEFQKQIFKTKRMVLTEAKRHLTLYRVFDEELREEFKVDSYYDIIDIADSFFKFYREMNISLVEKLDGLEKWQEDFILKYEKLKEKYDKYLRENEFVPSDWVENIENFDDFEISKFKEIVFIDIPYFSPLMTKIIKELDEKYKISIMLQIPEDDYNEELLKIEKVSLVKDKINLKVYENSDEMSEILNLIYNINFKNSNSKKDLYSPLPERNNYSKMFPKYFITQKLNILDDTLLYKFMQAENSLLSSMEPKKNFAIPVEEFKKVMNVDIFRKIYKIDEKIYKIFKKIFSEEYRYLSKRTFESYEFEYIFKEEDEKILLSKASLIFYEIYDNLEKLKTFKTVSELLEHLKEFGMENFRENNYTDIVEKFYEAIDNIKSSEKLCGSMGFINLFKENIGLNLYTLLIKYMEGIEIREVEKDLTPVLGMIKSMDETRLYNGENINKEVCFVDINSSTLPGKIKDSLNLTEAQRLKNRIISFEEKKLMIKYRFIQGIFNNKNVVIYSRKSMNNEVDRSIFLDELMLKYKISIEENLLSKNEIFNILYKNLIGKNELCMIEENKKSFELDKSFIDFEDSKLVLGAYDIINIKDCEYKYFLDKIAKIHAEEEDEYGVSLKLLGIIVHKVFERISERIYKQIKGNNDFSLDEKQIDGVIYRVLQENQMKIPIYIDLYFREVLFPKIKKNIVYFYKKLERELAGKDIKIFWGEKGRTEKIELEADDIDVFITGRADLIIETYDGKKMIVDYKTGGKRTEQLDIYSIIMYGDEQEAEKIIYNVIEAEYEKITKLAISKEELELILNKFISEKKYSRAEKKTSCNNCEYINICRKEEK